MARWGMLIVIVVLASVAYAQSDTDCDEIVTTALEETDETCFTIGRNEVCYGHYQVTAYDDAGEPVMTLAEIGDVTDIVDIAKIQTAELNLDDDQWGIVLMRLQANVQGSIPGQPVTFLLFGDAQLSHTQNESSTAHGFVLTSGIGTNECGDLPTGGVIFQSPEGPQQLNLTLNNVDITAGSTLFAQLTADGTLQVALIEGDAQVSFDGVTQPLEPETAVQIPIGDDGLAESPPQAVENFDINPITEIVKLLPGDPTVVSCPVGQGTISAPEGLVYFQNSDGPHFPDIADVFSYSVAIDGVPLPAVSDVFFDPTDAGMPAYRQLFDAGVLRAGEYTLSYVGNVNREITDPLDQTWGPATWEWECTLIVEA